MKKKLFALFLIVALMLCMIPAAFAADDEITLDVIICQYGHHLPVRSQHQ